MVLPVRVLLDTLTIEFHKIYSQINNWNVEYNVGLFIYLFCVQGIEKKAGL
jgi:hypothetical protein